MSTEEGLAVTAAIIERDGRVLIARRPPGARHAGEWEFPGGKVEEGETGPQCLARELEEELGLTVEVGRLLGEVVHDYGDLRVRLMAFQASITGGAPRDIECSAHAWPTPGELSLYELLPPDRVLARELFGIEME
jgi:8-oxo-dGTP diphosphatase